MCHFGASFFTADMNHITVIMISDYGVGDPAFTEVMLQIKMLLPGIHILPQSVAPFSTVNTGFWISQIAMTAQLQNTYIYSNTAPRMEDAKEQKNNYGEKLMYAKLQNGFEILAVNSKYVFSFVKPFIKQFRYVFVDNEGSQFRSRDKFPKAVAKMIKGDTTMLGKSGDRNTIPEIPANLIASVDGYGNIKTTIRQSQLNFSEGQTVLITVNGETFEATFVKEVFNSKVGQLIFAPGSSGHDDKFIEFFVRGSSAYELFKRPRIEEEFQVSLP